MAELTMDKLVALCKSRGFIFPGSEIYGGLANSWDYGPLGVEFKNNVKRACLPIPALPRTQTFYNQAYKMSI